MGKTTALPERKEEEGKERQRISFAIPSLLNSEFR
jgi:hypothetical protein